MAFFLIAIVLFLFIVIGSITLAGYYTTRPGNNGVNSGAGVTEFFAWTIGNGAEIFTQIPIPIWPYVKFGNEAFVTYSVRIPAQTPADPNLPMVAQLPVAASQATGEISLYSFALPPGETSIEVVLFSSMTIAFRYLPSGTYVVGGDITTAWNIVFWVKLLLA